MLTNTLRTRRTLYRIILFAGDGCCAALSMLAAYQARFFWEPVARLLPPAQWIPSMQSYLPLLGTAMVLWMTAFTIGGMYRRVSLPASDEFLRVLKNVLVGWILLLAATALYKGSEYSRLVLGMSAVLVALSTFLFRQWVKFLYARVAVRLWEPHAVLVLGSGRMSLSIQNILSAQPGISLLVGQARDPEELRRYLKGHPIREVYVGEPDLDHAALIGLSEVCDEFDLPFRIVPDVLELRMGEVVFDDSLGLPTYQVKPVALHGWTFFYKRLFDILGSIALLSLGIFPLLLIALWVRLDSSGPVFFKQTRLGLRRRPFSFFKFRSMAPGAERLLESLLPRSERPGPVFKMKDDPRVTRAGRWLRRYSLDELPQLLNVLRGEMSLVGPRPQVLREAAACDDWARKRLNVLPGITGLWQVSGRAGLSFEQMIDLDIFYVEHWSPGLDLKILLKTVPTVLGGQGAY